MKEVVNIYSEPVRKKFKRMPVVVNHPLAILGFDLIDFRAEISAASEGSKVKPFSYVAVWIDLFSRFVSLTPIVSKSADSIRISFNNFLTSLPAKIAWQEGMAPIKIWSDEESGLKSLVKNIKFLEVYHTNNSYEGVFSHSNPISERFNREFRKFLADVAVRNKGRKTLSKMLEICCKDLPEIYNNSTHSRMKFTPNEIVAKSDNDDFIEEVREMRAAINKPRHFHTQLKKGDKVYLQRPYETIKVNGKTLNPKYFEKPFEIEEVTAENLLRLKGIENTRFYPEQILKYK